MTSAHEHRRVLREVRDAAEACGLLLRTVAVSPITGSDGNREFLFWLTPRPDPAAGATVRSDMLDSFDVEGET